MATIPEPECVRIKREAHERLSHETAGMSREQRDAYINRTAADYARELGFTGVSSPIGRRPAVSAPTPDERRVG